MSYLLKKSLLMLGLMATIAVAQAGMAVGQLGVGEAQAVVDIGTGEIILELGTNIQILGVSSSERAVFDLGAFDSETTGLGEGSSEAPGIGFLGLTPFPAGTFNLGAILAEPFRTLEGVEDLFVEVGVPAIPRLTLTVANGGITVINSTIPEPGSMSLFALASLGVVARRRR